MISRRFLIAIASVLLFVSLSGCGKIKEFAAKFGKRLPTQKLSVETDSGKYEFTVEVADDMKERQRGYMFRKKIGENEGMWFVFSGEDERKFWMKNTKVSLDILFINKNLEIRGMVKKAQPCVKDPCPTYNSPSGIAYALEVPAGFADAKGVQIGDRIILPKDNS